MTQNARPRYGTPRWVKWFAGIVVVLIAIVVVAAIFAEGEESDDDVPVAPAATETVTPTTVVTSVPTATPTPRPTLAPPSKEEIANRCAKQYRHLVGNDEDGYRCGDLNAEGYNRKRERERQARIESERREEEARTRQADLPVADGDYAARSSNALDAYLAAHNAVTRELTYAGATGDFSSVNAAARTAGNAADALKRIRPIGASRCIQDADNLVDQSMDTYMRAMNQIMTGVRLADAALLVDASDNMDRVSSQMLRAVAKIRECASQ